MYRGLADHSKGFRRRGIAVLCVLLVGAFVQAVLGAGNSNGFGSFGSDRLEAADALYVLSCVLRHANDMQSYLCCLLCVSQRTTRNLGIVGYWQFVIVIESIAWLTVVALGGFTLYKIFTVRLACFVCVLHGVTWSAYDGTQFG